MSIADKPYAETWLDHLKSCARCEWCGSTDKLNRRGLCNHCNDVRKAIDKWQKIAREELPTATEFVKYEIEREAAIAEAKRKNCMGYGNSVKNILNGVVNGLALEYQLSSISQKMTDKDHFHGLATQLDWTFTQTQKQVMAYLMWEILSIYARKNRRPIAEGIVERELRRQRERSPEV